MYKNFTTAEHPHMFFTQNYEVFGPSKHIMILETAEILRRFSHFEMYTNNSRKYSAFKPKL